jgi:hypothetical protein
LQDNFLNYQISHRMELREFQVDCKGPCPYGCAYGAGPPSNKVKWFCGSGRDGLSLPRLSGAVGCFVPF